MCDKLKSSALLYHLCSLHGIQYLQCFLLTPLCSLTHHLTHFHRPHRFKHFYPPCTESFCKAAEVLTTVIGHVVGGSMFWAMHIPLHQLWGLKDPSQPPSGAEVPAPGTEGWLLLWGFGLQRHRVLGCCMMYLLHFCLGNAPVLGNMRKRPERNHYTENVLISNTNSCEEKRGQKTAFEVSSWLGCRQPCCCLQKYFYSPKWLESICAGFIIKAKQHVPK